MTSHSRSRQIGAAYGSTITAGQHLITPRSSPYHLPITDATPRYVRLVNEAQRNDELATHRNVSRAVHIFGTDPAVVCAGVTAGLLVSPLPTMAARGPSSPRRTSLPHGCGPSELGWIAVK